MRRRLRPVAALDYWGTHAVRRYIAVRILHAILIDRAHPMKVRGSFGKIVEASMSVIRS